MSKLLHGVIAATATPLTADFAPDVDRLLRHLQALLDGGCDGINLLGTTGEATFFSIEQRLALMRVVAESGLPLDRFMVGTGVPSLADTVRLTNAVCELGFAGALVLPPFFYPGITDEGLLDYMSELMRQVAHPRLAVYLYHIPQNTGVPWPIEVAVELRRRFGEPIAGLKDSSGDLSYARAVVQAIDGFAVFPSSEASLADADRDGYAGCISATVNLTSEQSQAAWSGRSTETGARAAQQASRIRSLFAKYPLVSAVKHGLARRYADPEWARVGPPLRPLGSAEAVMLMTALDREETAA